MSFRTSVRTRWPQWTLAICISLYLCSRLWRLTDLPIFLDEAIQMIWGWRLWSEGRWVRAASGGKLLSAAITGLLLRLPGDALWLARLGSVAAGAISLACAWILGRWTGGAVVGAVAAALYVANPFLLLHDRICLADSWLAAFSSVVLVAAFWLVGRPGWKPTGLLSLSMLACAVAKTSGVVFWIAPLSVVALVAWSHRATWKYLATAYAGPMLVMALHVWLVPILELKAKTPMGDPHRWAWERVAKNLGDLWGWVSGSYYGVPMLAVATIVVATQAYRRRRSATALMASAVLPAVALCTVADWLAPRYFLMCAVPLLVATAHLVILVDTRWWRFAALGALILAGASWMTLDAEILTSPATARIAPIDHQQYVAGWTAGYGSRETWNWLKERAKADPHRLVVVAPRPTDSQPSSPGRQLRALDLDGRSLKVVEVAKKDLERTVCRWEQQGAHVLVLLADGDGSGMVGLGDRGEHRFNGQGRVFATLREAPCGEP